MADEWEANLAAIDNTINALDTIQRKALRAAAESVAPRLAEAAPVRVSPKQGGNSLAEGALKAAVRPLVAKNKETGRWEAVVDFGKLTWIAHIVDIGHNPPHSVIGLKLGKEVDSSKTTPAYPFIREVQDSQRATAQEAYEKAMTAGINAALQGKK